MNWVSSVLLVVLILDAIVALFLIYTMWKKYALTKITAVGILLGFFVIDTLFAIVEISVFSMNQNDLNRIYLDVNQPFPIIFSAMGIIGAGAFLLFIDYYESEGVSIQNIAVFSAVLSAFLTFNWIKLLNLSANNEFTAPVLTNTPISFDFLPAIIITYMLIVSFPRLIKLRNEAELEKKKSSIEGLMYALGFLFVVPSIFITIGNFFELGVNNAVLLGTLIPRTGVLTGNLFLLKTYATASPAFLHSQKIEKLMVITKHGVPIYTIDFIETSNRPDDILISGSLTALSGLLAESIEVTDLEVIQFLEKEVLIQHQKTVGFFLITDRPSQFVWNALRSTANEISKEIGIDDDKPDRVLSEMVIDEKIDLKVKEIFGLN